MENAPARKQALCKARNVVLRPNEPYIFVAVPGCAKCKALVAEANEAYEHLGESFDFTDPDVADLPVYATTGVIPIVGKKKAKKKK